MLEGVDKPSSTKQIGNIMLADFARIVTFKARIDRDIRQRGLECGFQRCQFYTAYIRGDCQCQLLWLRTHFRVDRNDRDDQN